MTNTAWITNRREDVSYILVDSLQRVGNSSMSRVSNTLDCSTHEIKLSNINENISTEVEPSLSMPSSDIASSTTDVPVVPRLDFSLLDVSKDRCGAMEKECETFACIICGKIKTNSTDSVSVFSCETNKDNQNNADRLEDSYKDISDNIENSVLTSKYILQNIELESQSLETLSILEADSSEDCNENVSMVSLSCADPEEIAKEIIEYKLDKTDQMTLDKTDKMENQSDIDSEDNIVLPEVLKKANYYSTGNERSIQGDELKVEEKSMKEVTNVSPGHTTVPTLEYPILPRIKVPKNNLIKKRSPTNKERKQSFGFTLPQEVSKNVNCKPSKQNSFRKLLNKFKKKERSDCNNFLP